MRRCHVDPSVIDALTDARLLLPETAQHRFSRVLRLETGALVEVFDGRGRLARGRLTGDGALADVVVEERADGLPELVVAQAVVTADKLEDVVKKGTELGASSFVLFETARGQVHLAGDRADKRRDRLVRIAEDAARQSGRARVPAVEGPVTVAALAERVRAFAGMSAVGALDASSPLSEALAARDDVERDGLLIVVGPEGGLDPGEIERLTAAGAVAVRLGAHVLRTETAALVALAAAQARLGHL